VIVVGFSNHTTAWNATHSIFQFHDGHIECSPGHSKFGRGWDDLILVARHHGKRYIDGEHKGELNKLVALRMNAHESSSRQNPGTSPSK